MTPEHNTQPTPLKPGDVMVEVVAGCEGHCLVIGNESGGYRIAGPKPWGGGSTVHRFRVSAAELTQMANEYAKPEPPK